MTGAPASRRSRPPRLPTLPATLLRDAIARQLAAVSLRQAANEIGLTPNALRHFVAGAEPRATTRAQLERWLASRKTAGGHPQVGELVRLIGDLAIDLSPAQTTTLGRETALLLLGAYQERHLPHPRWVRELAEHYRVPKSR